MASDLTGLIQDLVQAKLFAEICKESYENAAQKAEKARLETDRTSTEWFKARMAVETATRNLYDAI